jgi:hypothetical protein
MNRERGTVDDDDNDDNAFLSQRLSTITTQQHA